MSEDEDREMGEGGEEEEEEEEEEESEFDEEEDDGMDEDFIDETEMFDELMDDSVDVERSEPEFTYEVIPASAIAKKPLEEIKKVNSIFEIETAVARQLLVHFKWNSERLLDKYYSGDKDKIFAEAGVPKSLSSWKKPKGKMECDICFDTYDSDAVDALPCGHFFCKECWNDYLDVAVNTSGEANKITCPAADCNLLADEVTVDRLLKDAKTKSRYTILIAKSFVHDNKYVNMCPNPSCSNAIKVVVPKPKEVECSCGKKFCFQCGDPHHAPATCKMIGAWKKKLSDDSETINYIVSMTKECPACARTIYKDGGCQYMCCVSCKHKFCWICLGAFDHKNHTCNSYSGAVSKDSARAAFNKFNHFHTRWALHDQAIKLQKKLRGQADALMKKLTSEGMAWIDAQYLKRAVDITLEARGVLKTTYIYGYFLPEKTNIELFEYLQANLESTLEQLSEILEGKKEESTKERGKVMDLTKNLQKRLENLLKGLAEGDIKGGAKVEKKYEGPASSKYNGWIYKAGS